MLEYIHFSFNLSLFDFNCTLDLHQLISDSVDGWHLVTNDLVWSVCVLYCIMCICVYVYFCVCE